MASLASGGDCSGPLIALSLLLPRPLRPLRRLLLRPAASLLPCFPASPLTDERPARFNTRGVGGWLCQFQVDHYPAHRSIDRLLGRFSGGSAPCMQHHDERKKEKKAETDRVGVAFARGSSSSGSHVISYTSSHPVLIHWVHPIIPSLPPFSSFCHFHSSPFLVCGASMVEKLERDRHRGALVWNASYFLGFKSVGLMDSSSAGDIEV